MLAATLVASPARSPQLAHDGRGFLIDGKSTWLAGVSLFDALGPTPPRDEDLDTIRNAGIRIVRVWAHWHDTIYDAKGALTATGRTRLRQLIDRLRARGLLLELVLLRPGELKGQPYAAFDTPDARLAAVRSVTTTLVGDRDVLFDVFNEHDHPDGPISHAALRTLRDAVKAIDRKRLVTVSSTETHLLDASDAVGAQESANLLAEAGRGPGQVGVDILSAHLPRTDDFADHTAARLQALAAALKQAGSPVPIYLNEPKRATEKAVLTADTYRRAAAGARAGGAAGWVFHTAAGFDLGKVPFAKALTPEERRGLIAVGEIASKPR